MVGGGISGLAAAWFYRRAAGPSARILMLDNHDDFGGHAKRNEFTLDGRLLIGYGGSESMQSPEDDLQRGGQGLLRELGVEVARFETRVRAHALFLARPVARRVLCARGVRARRAGGGRAAVAERRRAHAPPRQRQAAGRVRGRAFRSRRRARRSSWRSTRGTRDPLAGKTVAEKRAILKRTSYRDYLIKVCGCSEEVANCFQGRTLGFFGLGCDAVPAADARDLGYPGFAGPRPAGAASSQAREPYIYHFPDGNASLARLLVRALIPDVAPGQHAWTTWCWRHSTTASSTATGRLSASGSTRPASTCATPARRVLRRLCARRRAAPRRGQARGARLLPHGDPAHHAGVAGAAARRRWRRTSRRRSSTPTC